MRKLLLTGILFLGLAEFGYGAWIPAKAWLSQVLLAHAWQHSLDTGELQKPWPWADTWPVLKLTHTPSNTQLLVLQGDSGQAMAFGPGLTSSSMMPGETLIIQNRQDRDFFYQITAVQVVDSSNTQIQINTNDDRMTLVTCYPFNKITPGGDLRYVVTAIKQPSLHI
jgi:sortase A